LHTLTEDSFKFDKDEQLLEINNNSALDIDAAEGLEPPNDDTKDIPSSISKQAKRLAMRQFLDLKRLLDREGSLITAGGYFVR
jgi:hypothetical protein